MAGCTVHLCIIHDAECCIQGQSMHPPFGFTISLRFISFFMPFQNLFQSIFVCIVLPDLDSLGHFIWTSSWVHYNYGSAILDRLARLNANKPKRGRIKFESSQPDIPGLEQPTLRPQPAIFSWVVMSLEMAVIFRQ